MMITKEEYARLHRIDTSTVYAEIKKALETKSRNSYEMAVPVAAFALYQIQANPEKDYSNIEDFQNEFFDEEMGDFVPYYTSHHMIEWGYEDEEDGPWNAIIKLNGKFSQDELASCVLFGDKSTYLNDIPFNLNELVDGLLEINASDRVANYFSGAGSYLISSILSNGENDYTANACIDDYSVIAYSRLKLVGRKAFLTDSFELPKGIYDKAFCQLFMSENYEFGNTLFACREKLNNDIPDDSSIEWKVAAAIIDSLDENGKLAMIFRRNILSNHLDSTAREYFVKNGLIEKIICLPDRLYADRGKTVLIIFSRHNENIAFADFSGICSAGRLKGKSIDALEASDIKKAVNYTDYAIKSENDVSANNMVLDPLRYCVKDTANLYDEFESLKSLRLKVKRAGQFTALDIVSDEATTVQCIMPRNIQDGVIVKPLPYLRDDVDQNILKFKLRTGDIVITKNGNPFKVAVYENDEPGTVVANGNLYIIFQDYCKADPYFIKAFFESKKGIELLEAYSQGNTVPMITLDSLVNIKIPYPNAETRQRIATRCEEISKNIMEMHRSIESERQELSELFD